MLDGTHHISQQKNLIFNLDESLICVIIKRYFLKKVFFYFFHEWNLLIISYSRTFHLNLLHIFEPHFH